MSQDYHHSDVALSDEFHDAPDTYTPDDHSQPQFHHDQYDDEVQENQYDDDDYQDEDEEDEDQFHDSDPGVEEELTDPIHAQQLGEEHDLQLPVDHEQPLHASGSASDLHPASLPVQPDNGSSAAPLLSPSASDSRAPPSSEHDAVAQQTPALQSLSTPPADPNLPQVIVTSTSPQHTPDGPPDPSQPIASPPQPAQPQSPSPQVVVVPQAAAAPSPTTAPAPQVILQSPPPVVQPQIVQPQLQQSFTAAVPMAYPGVPMMSLQSDFTEQNIATVYNNLTSALVGHPPPPTAGPSYLPPTPTSLPPSTLPPPQHSPPRARSRSPAPPDLAPSQPPSRANSGARAGPSQNRSPRTPRTSQTSGARVAVPGKRTSPPRRLSDNAQTPTTPTNVAPPPSNRNSALYQPTPVTTPIAEHPEYDLYESPTQEAQRGHARAASAQAAAHVQDEVPPPPPPAYLKPVSRPPSVYVSERATGHDPNILTQSPLTSPGLSPAPPVHSGRFEQQQQQQPPHIVRRAATTGHSGHPQQTRPIYERRGRSYDDETQHSPPSGQLPQRSASIHASIPVGGIVNGQTILAQAHAPGAELDLTPSGIHMNLNVNAGELPGADAVRRDVSALRNQGAEFVREQSNVVRQHGADVYNQGLEAVRQGTNLYAQSADAVRQGVNSVRSGAEGLRQGATRTVSFLGDAQRGLDVNTLAAGAGSLAAGYLMGGHGGQGNGHASPQHISPQHTSGNGVGNGNGNPGMTMEGYLSRQSGLDTFVPVVGAKNPAEKTLEERLKPTLDNARAALSKSRVEARVTGWTLNIAIGIQVLLGALTTGIAAALSGKNTSIAISVLGGVSTLCASYLAKARGSGEPERSSELAKELENFVRDCDAFCLDHGHKKGEEGFQMKEHVDEYRRRFEILMGHNGDQVADSLDEKKERVVMGAGAGVGVGSMRSRSAVSMGGGGGGGGEWYSHNGSALPLHNGGPQMQHLNGSARF